jgi:predicted site-specific integrase-resolvase
VTGNEAAAALGISRRSLYRWAAQGRLHPWQWTEEQIEARRHELQKRPRGPRRNPDSKRYHEGRHAFTKEHTR